MNSDNRQRSVGIPQMNTVAVRGAGGTMGFSMSRRGDRGNPTEVTMRINGADRRAPRLGAAHRAP